MPSDAIAALDRAVGDGIIVDAVTRAAGELSPVLDGAVI